MAGTFKMQFYETGIPSFIASGNSPYFTCDNKGCDPTKPVALTFHNGTIGDFTLKATVSLPKAQGASKDFKLVVWGEDQDHEPYDFSATLTYSYGNGP